MITKQKIKKCIIILTTMIILTLSCVFYKLLHPMFINLFANRFNIVSNKGNLLVHFINVGQADASAINLPDGKVVLIDTGSEEVNTDYIKYIKENVVNSKRNNYIDYLILSHADMDHVGGTIKLLKNFKVGKVFIPKLASDSQGYSEILSYVEKYCNYQELGEEFIIKSELYSIKFFEILDDNNTNDSSQLIEFECFDKSFLFCGDISSTVEQKYIDVYMHELDCDVLKISHHGSNSSTSENFLNITTPEYAVISVGLNDYGHPTEEVLNRLNINGINTLRTDRNGNILFVVGKYYDLKILDGIYHIMNLSLNYVSLVLLIDGLLLVLVVVVIIKKEKNKKQ